MKQVYKYSLHYADVIQLVLPHGAKPLYFDIQSGVPTLWALIDPNGEHFRTRTFRFAGTGHPIEGNIIAHIGSTIDREHGLVWHLFEVEGTA